MSLENIYTFCQFLHSFRKFRRTNAKEKIKSSENYLVGFLLQHIHDKTIIVEDIKNTITLKKKKRKNSSETFVQLYQKRVSGCILFKFKWLVSARVLHVKNSCTTTNNKQQTFC